MTVAQKLAVLSCILLRADIVYGLAFCPMDRSDQMWECAAPIIMRSGLPTHSYPLPTAFACCSTWLYRMPSGGWLLNYLVKHHSSSWNAVSTALSTDGVHFSDAGVGILKDCANATDDCAVWLGSGSVWKRLSGADQEVEEYIMNFSQVRNRS